MVSLKYLKQDFKNKIIVMNHFNYLSIMLISSELCQLVVRHDDYIVTYNDIVLAKLKWLKWGELILLLKPLNYLS